MAAAATALEENKAELTKAEAEVEKLNDANTEREETSRIAELADERSDQVKEVTKFSDEQLAERKEGWAKMEDSAFEALLADLKEVSESAESASTEKGKTKVPKSKLEISRETAGKNGTDGEVVKKFFGTLQDA